MRLVRHPTRRALLACHLPAMPEAHRSALQAFHASRTCAERAALLSCILYLVWCISYGVCRVDVCPKAADALGTRLSFDGCERVEAVTGRHVSGCSCVGGWLEVRESLVQAFAAAKRALGHSGGVPGRRDEVERETREER